MSSQTKLQTIATFSSAVKVKAAPHSFSKLQFHLSITAEIVQRQTLVT